MKIYIPVFAALLPLFCASPLLAQIDAMTPEERREYEENTKQRNQARIERELRTSGPRENFERLCRIYCRKYCGESVVYTGELTYAGKEEGDYSILHNCANRIADFEKEGPIVIHTLKEGKIDGHTYYHCMIADPPFLEEWPPRSRKLFPPLNP